MATKKPTDVEPRTPASVTYRDTVFSSRVVIVGERVLNVVGSKLQVDEDDAEALACLEAHADFERLTPAE
ncbi:hypothetical protein C6A77_19235 [Pseudomonas sp. AFG_SD02_1510_Pfu_092]|uniref:hypothetical protein n=1 Tax=Pseudomonas sp. AFG_SD02_1510_Pfu_092 TaxID=2259497 RepID=UPI000DEFBFF6|nr:hypothetical protein [Pseudomonas sp. AFG_SD02_1510_Pfu_092]RCL22974.1 hypothetical protein C6A77_19235 [Pseudomonas sp. AFG_SD02_1510_Pfu_092]